MSITERRGGAFKEGSSWFHRYKVLNENGTITYSKKGGFSTYKEAEESKKKYDQAFVDAVRKQQAENVFDPNITLYDYLINWFENQYAHRIDSTTKMVGAYALYNMILPVLDEHLRLQHVNTDYINDLLKEIAPACESAGNMTRSFLNQSFKDAVIQGLLEHNPVTNSKPYPRHKPRVRVLSREKIKVLLYAAYSSKEDWYLEVLLGLFAGLRKGEILGLKFSDINFQNETISVSRQITANPIVEDGGYKIADYAVIEKPPKTDNSYRTIKVPTVIVDELERRKIIVEKNKEIMGDKYHDLDYVSCQPNGLSHGTSSLNNHLSKLCARNGLPHITVHALRHMFATILLEQGVPIHKVSALLGHSSVVTTFQYYADIIDEEDKIIDFMNYTFIPDGGN